MDYSKMSDFEINQKVGDMALNGRWACKPGSAGNETNNWQYGSGDPSLSLSSLPDYCNNPADAWPIIVGHKLSLINADDEWLCVPDDTAVDGTTGDEVQMIYSGDGHVHANPLRAAMIVFLMMQRSANVQDNPA